MKILIGSHEFAPSVGGIETVSQLLATEFASAGHSVRVVTQTEGDAKVDFPVLRRPRRSDLIRAVAWCDVFWQNNISLRTLWPLLFLPRPLVITHQTWITQTKEHSTTLASLKRFAMHRGRSIAISSAIARELPVPAVIIGNPYDDATFVNLAPTIRERELIYVGRLVSDKGVDLLINALSILHKSRIQPRLTIVGDGPERTRLEAQTQYLRLHRAIDFVGVQSGAELAHTLNQHRILVVPSRWAEPFGIVALEAIACGCVVTGSDRGGLPEAIGPCGVTFANNDVNALVAVLTELLRDRQRCEKLLGQAPTHLGKFTRAAVARCYLDLFESLR